MLINSALAIYSAKFMLEPEKNRNSNIHLGNQANCLFCNIHSPLSPIVVPKIHCHRSGKTKLRDTHLLFLSMVRMVAFSRTSKCKPLWSKLDKSLQNTAYIPSLFSNPSRNQPAILSLIFFVLLRTAGFHPADGLGVIQRK